MTALVIAETFLLALLTVLVVGLLRAFADIQERVEGLQADGLGNGAGGTRPTVGAELSPLLPIPPDRATPPAAPISGASLTGDPIVLSFAAGGVSTMLCFLESGCLACQSIFRELGATDAIGAGPEFQVVIVTRDTTEESPSRLAELAPPHVPMVMSSTAWEAYAVPGSPYFVYIDGFSGDIHGEGAGEHWEQVKSLLKDAMYDAAVAQASATGGAMPVSDGAETADERARRAEQALAAAGIPLDDPSLYGDTTGGARQ